MLMIRIFLMTKILIFGLLFAWNYLVLRLAFEVGGMVERN
jgi:hypothetical protein